MQVDFLIVGQGLAGTLLAQALCARGQTIAVVDDGGKSSASKVAAGLLTPLTGRRFTLAPAYPELFAFAERRLTALGVFHPHRVYRMFADEEQKAKVLQRVAQPAFAVFIDRVTAAQGEIDSGLTDTLGGVLMRGAWVDLPKLLSAERDRLQAAGSYFSAHFDPAELSVEPPGIRWQTVQARGVIYCDGYKSAQRGPFTYMPWRPAKGEALSLRSDAPQKPFILNREGWALPLGEGRWRTGTNWAWEGLDETPTEVQKEKLLRRFRSYFTQGVSVEVTAHAAGVRPCTADNMPFLGTHPEQSRFHLFNGLGPRGTVWAPQLAEEMADFLVHGKPVRPECAITRTVTSRAGSDV